MTDLETITRLEGAAPVPTPLRFPKCTDGSPANPCLVPPVFTLAYQTDQMPAPAFHPLCDRHTREWLASYRHAGTSSLTSLKVTRLGRSAP